MKNFSLPLAALLVLGGTTACGASSQPVDLSSVPKLEYEVVAEYPHDKNAFTQGLLYSEGILYESTGNYGDSTLRKVEITTGKVIKQHRLDDAFFGEGLALFGEKLYQLTWKEGQVLVYDADTLAQVDTLSYWTEGWGLTTDGQALIMSDGTSFLTWRDPETFEEQRKLRVTVDGRPLDQINELEFIDDKLWANVWGENFLVRIDPTTGKVDAWMDLQDLAQRNTSGDVLNGIAWNPEKEVFYVTGKLWYRLYILRLKETDPS